MNITITLESNNKILQDESNIKSQSELEVLTMQFRNKGRELQSESKCESWQIYYTAKSKI